MKLRSFHWLPVVLILLWAVSPVGSQSSLRFLFLEESVVPTTLAERLAYVYPMSTFATSQGSWQADAHYSIFLSFFLSTSLYQHAAQDPWGNIKIPLVDSGIISESTDHWIQTPWHPDNLYSAISGIPFTRPQGVANISFQLQSWYWELENATLWELGSSGPLLEATTITSGSSTMRNYTATGLQWQFAIPASWNYTVSSTIPISFEVTRSGSPIQNSPNQSYQYAYNGDDWRVRAATRLDCVLVQKPVELNVSCTPSACNVSALRYTAFDANYSVENDLLVVQQRFLWHLAGAFPVEHAGTPVYGVLEAYLQDPGQNPYNLLNTTGDPDLTQLDARTMAKRLSQVLNTYWLVDNQFANAAGGFDGRSRLKGGSTPDIKNSSVTSLSAQDFLRRNDTWFVLLCVSTLLMVFASIVSLALTLLRVAPDATDFLSALTLNAAGSSLPDCSSYLDGDERVRVLKDTRLAIGDMQPNQSIGRIGIGQEGNLHALRKGRLYC